VNASSLILQRRYAAAALVALIIAVFAMSSLSAWRTEQHASHLTALIESGLVTSPPPSVTQLQSLVLELGNQITQHHQNETTSLLWAKRVFFVLALLALAWSLQLTKRLSRLAQKETERLRMASDQAIHALKITRDQLSELATVSQAVQCVGRDITLQRQAELKFEAANAQRLLLELCVAQLDDVVLIAEADLLDESNTHIVFVNDAMERVTGYKRSEVLGRSLSLLAGLQTGIQERDQIQTAMARGLPLHLELIHHRKDGTGYWTDLRLTPVTGTNGLLTHWISVHRDISARKQLDSDLQQMCDRALEASRLKSEFLATMSHEIRTPMNGVLGMVELLQSTALNHKQSLFLDALSQSAKGLMAIIDNILDFSALEARALQVEQQAFDLQLWLNTCLNRIEAQVLTKQLALFCRLDPALPSHLIGDARRLQQVLLSLLDNAVKFTAAGRITVTLRPLAVTQAQAGVQWVRCEVQDTGIGLSRDNRRRLFQPFQQIDGSNARAFSGVGLGLALSHQLVALMQGHIGVDSEPGQGSTFWFEVPLVLPPVALHIAP